MNGLDRNHAVYMTILSSITFGSSYVAIRIGVGGEDPFLLSAGVMTVGVAALLVFMFLAGSLKRDMLRHWEFWAAPLVNTGVVSLQYIGLGMTTASAGGLIIGSNVLFVAIFSFLVFKERMSGKRVIGLALGFVGLITITTKWSADALSGGELLGDLCMLGSAICIALVMLLSRSALEKMRYDQWTLSLHALLPFSLLFIGMLVPGPDHLTDNAIYVMLYLGLICTTLPTLLWTKALPRIGIVTSATVLMLESTFAVLLSVIILDEGLDVFIVSGALMTFAAIYLVANGSE